MDPHRAEHKFRPQQIKMGNIFCIRKIIWLCIALALLACLLSPQIEAKKLKEKKLLKKLVKGLILRNLSVKKNFLPLPVPFPVRIELAEPPVYLKGKPKYVTIYKPAPKPVVQPIYTMPIYAPSIHDAYMMDPYAGLYSPSMYSQGSLTKTTSSSSSDSSQKDPEEAKDSESQGSNFTDYDDESGNYYMKSSSGKRHKRKRAKKASHDANRRSETGDNDQATSWLLPAQELESLDDEDQTQRTRRIKRQVYYSSGESYDKPCSGFPLEVNIKSRLKLDQVFPIHGNSQIRKCVKFPLPKPTLLPPPRDDYY